MKILYLDCFLGFDAGMLLGALIDLGLETKEIEAALMAEGIEAKVVAEPALRSEIECTKARVISLKDENSSNALKDKRFLSISSHIDRLENHDTVAFKAVFCALDLLRADIVLLSPVTLPPKTDGEVIAFLDGMNVIGIPSDEDTPRVSFSDALLIKTIITDCGPKPQMDIIKTGYGAGGESEKSPHLICGVLGIFNDMLSFEAAEDIEISIPATI